MKLTPQQQAALDHKGNLLLKACPGSGKTRTIVSKLVTEVELLRGTPFAVACITYTNAAVGEIDARVAAYLMPDDAQNYVISTIHSFCLHQILRPFASRVAGFNGGMKVLTPDRSEFMEIADFAAEKVGRYDLNFRDYERFGRVALDAHGNLIGSALEDDMIRLAAPHFLERSAKLGFIDFASIIFKALCLLRDDPEVVRSLATKFRFFLVDEFQDTTEIQIEILKAIHAQGKSEFFLVGDPAQSIFGFAGARCELIDPFADHIGARRDLSLSANFRSSPPIVEHAERLFPRDPEMTSEGKNKDCAEPPAFFHTRNTFTTMVEEYLPAIERMKLPLGRSAVLAKSWDQLYPIARGLREFGIPVVGPGARPYRRSRMFAVLAEQLCGAVIDGHTFNVRQLERAAFHAIQDMSGQSRFDIYSYRGRVTIIRLLRLAEAIAVGAGAVEWLEKMSVAAGEVFVQGEWIETGQRGDLRASVEEMKADMRQNQIDLDNLAIDDLGLFASPDRALRLTTIHEAKGREYAAVAIIGMREGTIPFYRAKSEEELQAEKRQFYVGVTRAEQLLVYICEHDRFGNPPSRFLGPDGVAML